MELTLPNRRNVMFGMGLAAAATALVSWRGIARAAELVEIENFNASGESLGKARLPKIVKSEEAWRKYLSAESFEVTREAGTETAFTGAYWNIHADGLFRCICCSTALFDSRDKFDSGTGWPSFTRPVSQDNIIETRDDSWMMVRTAVACKRCDAHLGHVFDDGPPPTGLRYCINSAALAFVPRAHGRA